MSGIQISHRISNKSMNSQILSLTERISKLEKKQSEQSNQIIELGQKHENFNAIIDGKINNLNENINKILEKVSKAQVIKVTLQKKKEDKEDLSYDSAEEDIEYDIPIKKRKTNNKEIPKLKQKAKRGPYNKESGPIYYYYSINNNIFKYTRIKKYKDYEDYRCSFTACKAKGKYVYSLRKFNAIGEHSEYESHSYAIALNIKKKNSKRRNKKRRFGYR